MEQVEFPVKLTVYGTFIEGLTKEDKTSALRVLGNNIKNELYEELNERIIPDIQKILPNVIVDIQKKSISKLFYLDIEKLTFKYSIEYLCILKGDMGLRTQVINQYKTIWNILRTDFNEIASYITTHQGLFDDETFYKPDNGFLEFNLTDISIPSKENIRARTAKRVLVGRPNLPLNVIGKIGNYIGTTLPKEAKRLRPLAEPLSDEAITHAATEAVSFVEKPVIPSIQTKKPWYKRLFSKKRRGGKRRKTRRVY